MPARSVGSGTVSFGLVSIPVRFYVATHSENPSFNMLHQPCGSRIKQQIFCPKCERTVERGELVKGFQFEKDRYVTFTDEELKAVEAEASRNIDIHEFVPLAGVDPLYYEGAHYLGPQAGAEKAYHLLVEAMRDSNKGALAKYTSHGKEHLGLIRPLEDVYKMAEEQLDGEVLDAKLVGNVNQGWDYDLRVVTEDGVVHQARYDAATLALRTLDGQPVE